MKQKNGLNSITNEINNFENLHILINKKHCPIEKLKSNGKEVLNNLIKKNKKYEDIYNLITLKTNNNNKQKILRGKRLLSEDKRINNIKNKNLSYQINENKNHIKQIQNLFNEIELFQNSNMKNLRNTHSKSKNKSLTKKNIFDSLNINTHFERPLTSNRSNINLLGKDKKSTFNNLNINNKDNQKNVIKSKIPKPNKKIFNDNEVKKWINQEKYGNGYNDNFYNEKKLNISNLMSFTRNTQFGNLKRNYSNGSSKNLSVRNYNNNYLEILPLKS